MEKRRDILSWKGYEHRPGQDMKAQVKFNLVWGFRV